MKNNLRTYNPINDKFTFLTKNTSCIPVRDGNFILIKENLSDEEIIGFEIDNFMLFYTRFGMIFSKDLRLQELLDFVETFDDTPKEVIKLLEKTIKIYEND